MYVTQQPLAMRGNIPLTVTVTAQSVAVGGSAFAIQNTGTNPIYIKEKNLDGVDVTAANGFEIPANTTLPFIMTAENLSITSGTGGSTANILLLDLV